MSIKRTAEFRTEAVRLALTSGLPRQQVADDLKRVSFLPLRESGCHSKCQ